MSLVFVREHGQRRNPLSASFSDVPTALTAFAKAAADVALAPDDAARRETLDSIRRGVDKAVAAHTSDVEFRSRTMQYTWHRRTLRTLLEEPEAQPSETLIFGRAILDPSSINERTGTQRAL